MNIKIELLKIYLSGTHKAEKGVNDEAVYRIFTRVAIIAILAACIMPRRIVRRISVSCISAPNSGLHFFHSMIQFLSLRVLFDFCSLLFSTGQCRTKEIQRSPLPQGC